jgi:Flp pilus assembly protein TadD
VGSLRADVALELSLWDYFLRLRAHGHRVVAVASVGVDHAAMDERGGASFDACARMEAGLDELLSAGQNAPDPARALEIYRAAVAKYPAQARSHQALGLAYLASGDTSKSIVELRAAVDRSPADPKLHNQLGYALAEAGDTFAAERSFRGAVELVPRQLDGLLNLVELYRRRRSFDAAATYTSRLAEVAPDHPEVLVVRAMLGLETGDAKTARAALDALRQINPQHPALEALASVPTFAA